LSLCILPRLYTLYFTLSWKEKGASIILSLRALVLTSTRWEQFWDNLNQYRFPVAA
jgi:hypothetical protein